MTIEIKVPVLPESVMDATVVKIYVSEGDIIEQDSPIMDLETDKVVLEVPASDPGKVTEIKTRVGDVVKTGETLAVLDETVSREAESAETEVTKEPARVARPAASPAAEKLAIENNIDLSMVTGSGKDQRITKQDVLAYSGQQEKPKPTANETSRKTAPPPEPVVTVGNRAIRREPMSRIRQRIAQRLVEVQHEAAILTTFNEIDMKEVIEARSQYREEFEKRYGARLGFMSFFVKACAQALLNYPIVNASIEGNDIVYHDYIDIGIAVSSPRGLVVPVLRDVEHSSFGQVETEILELAHKARDAKLTLDDLSGGTFSITNGGVFGSMLSTPLLNPPQSAILGMHNITQRPVVVDGEIVIRPMMYVALSYDHRLIDGRDAVQFLVSIKQDLEDPSRLLIGL